MRLSKFYLLVFLSVLTISSTNPESVMGQRRKQPVKRVVKQPTISLDKIYEDVVDKRVDVVNTYPDGRTSNTTWVFGESEAREIEVLQKTINTDTAYITIKMLTQDAAPIDGYTSRLRGNLGLNYERVAGGWDLVSIDNLSFKSNISGSAMTSSEPTFSGSETVPYTPQRNNQTQSAWLVNSSFTIGTGNLQPFRFVVANSAVVAGKFRAQGGSGNDIILHLLSEEAYENFINKHTVTGLYNSGKVTVGSINVTLGQGIYYLVFDNSFSTFNNKAVSASIQIQTK